MSATAQRDVPTSTGEVAVQRSEGSAMSKSSFPWHARPGLAGGIDKDGTRAAELLGLGFGSVEFGTVAVGPRAGAELAALRARLAALPPRAPGAIGIGLGQPADAAPRALAAWILMEILPPVAVLTSSANGSAPISTWTPRPSE